ncbi:MAG TPA: nuclear transport factor 2 family protein [Phototrophicaceae bacterium]|jgi:hypothetical protein|nr:nuclear transport factor 2 family protein [Phototrophicaceae bacterium]
MSVKSIEAEIVERAQARSNALVAKDVPVMTASLTPDFSYINASGMLLTRDEYLEHYVASDSMRWHSQAIDEIAVRVYADFAVVICRVHDQGVVDGETFDGYVRSTLVWIRRGAIWYCASGHSTEIRTE